MDRGTLTRAADELRISVPAAAKRVRQLEVLAHTPLLYRGRRGVTPTRAGARLIPSARRLLAAGPVFGAALAGAPAPVPLRIADMLQLRGRAHGPTSEEVLRQTEALLDSVFHASSDSMWISRQDDDVICEINDAGARLTGYERDEIRGSSVTELGLWEDMDRRHELVKRAVATREPQQARLVLHEREGQTLLVNARSCWSTPAFSRSSFTRGSISWLQPTSR